MPAARHRLDPLGDQLDVGLGQGRVPLVGEHDPLAADLVGRRHLAAQLGVLDRRVDLAAADGPERRQQPALAGQGRGAELLEGEDRGAVEALQRREAAEERAVARAE